MGFLFYIWPAAAAAAAAADDDKVMRARE